MTTESAHPGDDPHRLLSNTHELVQRVRKAQRATWFPLLVFAAATFASIPVYRYGGHHHFGTCAATRSTPTACALYPNGEFVYWPFALLLAYAVIAAFYIRRSRARGIETRVRPYAIAGIIIAAALTAALLWELNNPPANGPAGLLRSGLGWRLVTPTCAIGLALLILARAERNRPLLLLTLAYLTVVLVPINFGWAMDPLSPWYAAPRLVINGSVLLLGGIGFALTQRPVRSRAS